MPSREIKYLTDLCATQPCVLKGGMSHSILLHIKSLINIQYSAVNFSNYDFGAPVMYLHEKFADLPDIKFLGVDISTIPLIAVQRLSLVIKNK